MNLSLTMYLIKKYISSKDGLTSLEALKVCDPISRELRALNIFLNSPTYYVKARTPYKLTIARELRS